MIAGPRQTNSEGQRIHREMAERIRAVLDDQRLVSLDTLLALGDGLTPTPQGTPAGDTLLPLAEQLGEFQMPRPIFTSSERTTFTAGSYNNRHTDFEMRTDIAKVLKSKATGPELEQARGQLVPFFRDTLVGFSYAYYEPPGAQALHNNPLLIRSHDFSGETVMGTEESLWQTPRLFGARLSRGRWRASGGLAGRLALRAGANGRGFYRSGKCPGADLVGPGAVRFDQRRPAALVERQPQRTARRRALSTRGRRNARSLRAK